MGKTENLSDWEQEVGRQISYFNKGEDESGWAITHPYAQEGNFCMYTLFAHIEVWVYPTLHTVTTIGILADLYLVPHTLFFSAKISTKEVYCVFALLAKHFCCLLP